MRKHLCILAFVWGGMGMMNHAKAQTIIEKGTTGECIWRLSEAGVLTIKGSGAMDSYIENSSLWYPHRNRIKTIVINNGVTTIGNYAFYQCFKLTSITLGSAVASIGNNAFFNCNGLTSINFPISLTAIGNNAFEKCRNLTTIVIPDSVVKIGNNAFYDCTKLSSITIGRSVSKIGDYMLFGCTNLKTIVCKTETPPALSKYAFTGIMTNIPVVIPCNTLSVYKNSDWGKIFTNFVEDCK